MRSSILLALALFVPVRSFADTVSHTSKTRSLSLHESVDLALSRNFDLQIERLALDIATDQLRGSYGAYMPVFAVTARHDTVNQPANFDPKKTNPDLAYQLNSDTVGPSLAGAVPFGLSYTLGGFASQNQAFTDFNSVPAAAGLFPGGIRETNNYYADAALSLQQHLLRDAWIDANWERVLLLRRDLKISQQALQFQIMQTLLAVELGYFDLLAAREEIRVQEKALQLNQQFVTETHRRVQVGDLPPLDAEQAETQLQNSLTALAAARQTFTSLEATFKNLITDDFKAWVDVEIEPSDKLVALPEDVNRAASFESAMRNRPDLAQARLSLEKSAVEVRFRMNQLFPNVDLIGRYGGLGVQPDLGSTLSDSFNFRNPEYFYGIVLSVPLNNVSERNNYRASKTARQIAELQLRRAEQAVLVQVADWANRLESRFTQVGSTHQARLYAEAALDAEVKKLQNGFSTSFVVLQLQEILTAARTAEVTALADYNKAQAQFAFARGTTLERNQIRIQSR